jgi:hypothetical protein
LPWQSGSRCPYPGCTGEGTRPLRAQEPTDHRQCRAPLVTPKPDRNPLTKGERAGRSDAPH